MARYHINPTTGNPNVCRATKKCPFGGDEAHFDSAQQARRFYEEQMKESSLGGLSKQKISQGAKLLIAIDIAQKRVNELYELSKDSDFSLTEQSASHIAFHNQATHRDKLKDQLSDLPWDDSDAPSYQDEPVNFKTANSEFSTEPKKQGYSNDWVDLDEEHQALYIKLDQASQQWIRRLSTAEVKAVSLYASDATHYAKLMAHDGPRTDDDELYLKYFHSALNKAPRALDPFISYAGISPKRQDEIREQGLRGHISLTRVQSTSLNPAQTNGFTHWEKSVVIEFKQNRVASLAAFNVNRGEMELLVGPGEYGVLERSSNITYLWPPRDDGKEIGRTAETVFHVEEQ